jgi:glycosyltransferase involved in cell wall biosynthesis
LKVAIDGREFIKHRITGISRVLKNILLKLLREKPDWQFTLILNQYCEFDFDAPNLRKIYLNQRVDLFTDQIHIPLLLKSEKINIFYSPYYKCPIFTKVPKITTIHDLIYLMLNNSLFSRIGRIWYKIMSNSADRVITVSNNSAKDINRILGISFDKISVLPNSLDNMFRVLDKDKTAGVLNKYNLTKPYLLYVGNSSAHKNLKRLVEAYRSLPNEFRSSYTLVLAGVGNYNPSLTDCRVINSLKDDDLVAIYNGAKLFVFPSLYEGFGFPPLEAMACGCPVVSSNTSCMPEILKDACLYFDPENINDIADKINKALTNVSLLEGLRKKGLERASFYINIDTTQEFISIINTLTIKKSNNE